MRERESERGDRERERQREILKIEAVKYILQVMKYE